MADESQVTPSAFNCEGGLVLNKSSFMLQPGEAIELRNFEPDIEGGYRRISGFAKYVSVVVPFTSNSAEKVLMVATFGDVVLAARGTSIYSATPGGSSWTSRDSGRSNAGKYRFERFNFDGTDKLIVVDGVNAPTIFNSSLATTDIPSTNASTGESTVLVGSIAADATLSGSGVITVASTAQFTNPSSGTLSILIGTEVFTYTGLSATTFTGVTRAASGTIANLHETGVVVLDLFPPTVTGAKHVAAFKNHMFYSGMPNTPQEVIFSAPFDEDNLSVAIGAGSFKVDDEITGIKVFRDNLFIFCETRIFKLAGTSSLNFQVSDVTRNIGCINGDTIQEFAGDLIFLGPDGLRTIAGTARIGDVELGTISSAVQSIFNEQISSASEFDSVVITDKTQYRIFFTKANTNEQSTRGIICVLKGQKFEFAEVRGLRPACTDSFVLNGDVLVLHGDYDNGFIHRQEQGNTFDGTAISGKYRSPDLTFNDPGIRKHMQRVIVNYKPESTLDADLFVRYDYDDVNASKPAAYPLDTAQVATIYGNSATKYGAASTVYDSGVSEPLVRQAVEGSGFAVALKVEDGGITAPYSLKGFQLEYQLGARR